ncbi:coenzyme Q-binding protein [Canna indica]|uniref:Coenzyme Q-binding protein n=1 Tax=Canna indica TaxID=4628 RepID=A0AAQ3KFY2_9LILI|nr:coenzyme Q-binding protein [Canna indica]
MPPILSSSKAIARLLSRRNRSLDLGTWFRSVGTRPDSHWRLERFAQTRFLASYTRSLSPRIGQLFRSDEVRVPPLGNYQCCGQTRWFLGCGDGDEGNALSKIHEERRVIGYSPEQLFAVVAAVDMYEEFLPWCQRSKIIKRNSDGSFDAELEIGFKFLVESYVSHVEMEKPKYIKTTASESGIFDHLINNWEFKPGPVPGTCDLYFLVDFKFQSPLYSQVASMFFMEVVSRLVSSFLDRCHRIYGPGVRVLETHYGQST